MAGKVTIYHNPKCSKSRAVLEMLQAQGCEITVIDYLKTGWRGARLLWLIKASGSAVRDFLRVDEAWAKTLELNDPAVSDAAIVAAMLTHPELVQRPIVETEKGVRLCRPVEKLMEIL